MNNIFPCHKASVRLLAAAIVIGLYALVPTLPANAQDGSTGYSIFLPAVNRGGVPQSVPVTAPDPETSFIQSVVDGSEDTIRGVYAADTLALQVVQQPGENAGYVATLPGTATQFHMASDFGVIGLLAHNTLAGSLFDDLQDGQEVKVVYGDGSFKRYQVERRETYQALQPDSPYSDFVDLTTQEHLTSGDLFARLYTGEDRLVFQTCLTQNGITSWGRLFVIALPLDS